MAYWSRKLKDAETRYSATDLEWLAAVTAVTHVWYWLLEGRPFTLCSDYKALECKLSQGVHEPPINDRQARWIAVMSRFTYHFCWLRGVDNTVADALSRFPVAVNTTTVTCVILIRLYVTYYSYIHLIYYLLEKYIIVYTHVYSSTSLYILVIDSIYVSIY